ncbi:MAG: hypothetical protein ABSG62_14370 [Terracidiphilus sp.]
MRFFAISGRIALCLSALLSNTLVVSQVSPASKEAQTKQIVALMVEANARRARDLDGFTGKRIYKFQYRGFPIDKDAELVVSSRLDASGTKHFEVISESGSRMIVNRVLKRLLESERLNSLPQYQASVAVGPDNYRFELLGMTHGSHGDCYRMHVEPLRDSKYLFRGEIWVDTADFAVDRIDAELAKNPALWIIRRAHIQSNYEKIGEFWVPSFNRSESKITLGGTATLTVHYIDYTLTSRPPVLGH